MAIAWFKVDDGFASSPKVLSIPRRDRLAAIGLWTIAGTWAAKHLTDGVIPSYMIEEFGAEVSHGDILVDAGLWRIEGDGFVFHDWSDYQPKRIDVLAHRERERLRKEAFRAKKAGNAGQSPSGTDSRGDVGQTRVSGLPDPTRPDPTRPSIDKNSSRIDDAFESAWQSWPKKVEKKKSLAKFRLIVKTMPVDELTAHIKRFGTAYRDTTDRQYVPSLVAWLNGERWNDEPPAASTATINAQWDALMTETKDPCAGGHKWAVDGSCVRYPCPARRSE
jgi:hypothetical protein